MPIETKSHLNASTLEAVQELYAANMGSRSFYEEAAKRVDSRVAAQLFREVAVERETLARELEEYLGVGDEKESGTWKDSLHETWTKLRGLLNGGDLKVLLIETERAEDRIKARYESTPKDTAGSALNDVLQRQHRIVKARHDRIRDLRDSV